MTDPIKTPPSTPGTKVQSGYSEKGVTAWIQKLPQEVEKLNKLQDAFYSILQEYGWNKDKESKDKLSVFGLTTEAASEYGDAEIKNVTIGHYGIGGELGNGIATPIKSLASWLENAKNTRHIMGPLDEFVRASEKLSQLSNQAYYRGEAIDTIVDERAKRRALADVKRAANIRPLADKLKVSDSETVIEALPRIGATLRAWADSNQRVLPKNVFESFNATLDLYDASVKDIVTGCAYLKGYAEQQAHSSKGHDGIITTR